MSNEDQKQFSETKTGFKSNREIMACEQACKNQYRDDPDAMWACVDGCRFEG